MLNTCRRNSKVLVLLLLVCFLMYGSVACTSSKDGDDYPAKPVDMIVPWAAGGSAELPARVVADALSKQWGHPINVVNKPGGNTLTGALAMMQSNSDGYTVMADSPGSSSLQAAIEQELPFEIEDRTFIARFSKAPMVFFVNADSPWEDLTDVADAIKANPGEFSWCRLGNGSLVDLCLLQYFHDVGVDIAETKQVVYKGSSESAAAVAGGHVMFGCSGPGTVIGYVSSNTLRVIGVTGTDRVAMWPDVLTAIEQGFDSVAATLWNGFTGPKDLPEAVVTKWAEDVEKVLKDETVIEGLEKLGATPAFLGSEDFRQAVLDELKQAKDLSSGS